ncbi:MAG: hypothetical protein CMD27_02085 [Flavobacteriales bacterium]|nr:hypothetical protein [Flavobacteriales bacterium]|tara:strand:+ start:351 stop:1028 length:678 start_codon:yes stop_codon:yes gene_type:complete
MLQIYKVFIKNFFVAIGYCPHLMKNVDLISQSCSCIFCSSSLDDENTMTQISTASLLCNYLIFNSYNLKGNLIIHSIHCNDIFQNLKQKYSFIISAGGVVLNEKDEVLMILKNNIWDLPKGKKDMLESDSEAAVREVNEETNVKIASIFDGPFSTYHMYSCSQEQKQNNMILKETKWFLMHADSKERLRPQLEECINDVAWIPKKQVFQIKTYDSVKLVFEYFFN